MRVYLLAGLLCLFVLSGMFASVSVNATPAWNIKNVDEYTSGIGTVALDSDNNPHIVYDAFELNDFPNIENVMYASLNGSTWNSQIVASDAGALDLKLDLQNNPHILFERNGNLMYATLNGSNWNIQTIDDKVSAGSLQLDSAGNPHVAYLEDNGELKYASWTGTNWKIETVDSSGDFLNIPVSLALDTDNNPHILYGYSIPNEPPLNSFKYATWNGSAWTTETVVSNTTQGRLGNLALDPNGYPHFTYFANDALVYVSRNGSAWKSQVITYNASSAACLAFDKNDKPCIIYFNEPSDSLTGALIYATWTGKTWETQTIEPKNALEFGDLPGSLAIDSKGNPHVSFPENPPQGQIANYVSYYMYATNSASTQTPTLTVESTLVIAIPTIAILAAALYVWKRKTKTQKLHNAK